MVTHVKEKAKRDRVWQQCWTKCFVPPKLHTDTVIPNVVILGSGIFGKYLGHKGGALINGFCDIIKRYKEAFIFSLSDLYHVTIH